LLTIAAPPPRVVLALLLFFFATGDETDAVVVEAFGISLSARDLKKKKVVVLLLKMDPFFSLRFRALFSFSLESARANKTLLHFRERFSLSCAPPAGFFFCA